MELPAGTTVPASAEERVVVEDIFARALGKPSVNIRYVGHGGPGFTNYLFVEVDKTEKLAEWRPDVDHFVRRRSIANSPFFSNISFCLKAKLPSRTQILVVSSAGQDGIAYETRMFAPNIGVREDHVCGSAHCLNAPYWAAKAQEGHVEGGSTDGKAQHAKAVSARGGDIWASYFAAAGRVRMRGNVKLFAEGTLDLTDVMV
jgi:predicted PhzF superfamily epimerase YddE/YHI9